MKPPKTATDLLNDLTLGSVQSALRDVGSITIRPTPSATRLLQDSLVLNTAVPPTAAATLGLTTALPNLTTLDAINRTTSDSYLPKTTHGLTYPTTISTLTSPVTDAISLANSYFPPTGPRLTSASPAAAYTAPPPPAKPAPKPVSASADLGALVRAARKRMDLTQQAFADLAGVGRRFVSELEAGKPTLEIGKVIQVCRAAGIDLFARSRS